MRDKLQLSGKFFMGGLKGSPILYFFLGHMDEEKMLIYRDTELQDGSEAVFIDVWCPGIDENRVPEEDFLPGEIEAVTFQAGCYTVRSALRVYTIHNPDWYLAEVRTAVKCGLYQPGI